MEKLIPVGSQTMKSQHPESFLIQDQRINFNLNRHAVGAGRASSHSLALNAQPASYSEEGNKINMRGTQYESSLESMNPLQHESMTQVVESTFIVLDRLLVNYTPFQERVKEFIACASSDNGQLAMSGEIHHVVNPDPYHGVFGSDANRYAKDLQDHIDFGTSGKVAGFIAETIQGAGGAVELAPGYWKLVYDIVRKAGGVCIVDEVQTGFGRTGSNYWGFETQGVIPDIFTMAKGIGNGLPLGAVVTTPEIASVLAQKIQFNTFGGNPVCSAGGLAVLRVIDQEKRQAHCADVGSHLLKRLRALQQTHESNYS
ncbi:alanine--glyoxylate aminotransferase 2 homolog 1, mitochondrial-like [Quercus robur]|uniref:alanine--glyoxylate aminotransferase 2 homolog 1, mitochondrial-like n=1 Tax=Quercus robur TaxID=38942 RepID=UPI0021626C6A|nr:alanine--glyoxylate aminotransferase 2 homolog 1, mitochondrial-like [Quercus robur]